MAAATALDPPRKAPAGREGPLNWAPNPYRPNDEWLAKDGERCDARIRFLSNQYIGKQTDTYYTYRGGHFFGVRTSLPDAKKLAEADKPDQNPDYKATVDGTPEGFPAFLHLSDAEHKYLRKIAPPMTMSELRTSWGNYKAERQRKGEDLSFMAKYENMSAEQLALEYNKLVETARGFGLDRFRPVARFKDKDEGLRYVEAVESSIRARQTSEKAAEQQSRSKTGAVAKEVIPASPQPQPKGTEEMAKKVKKNGAAKKKAAAPKKAAAEKVARPGKLGAFLDSVGVKGGTAEKAATALFNSLGKPIKLEALCKAAYGKAEVVPAINAVINGLRAKVEAAKPPYNIQRDRKEGTVGLHSGKS